MKKVQIFSIVLSLLLLTGLTAFGGQEEAAIEKAIKDRAEAIYDYELISAAGGDRAEQEGKCTTILGKESTSWLVLHEHCSVPPEPAPAPE